MTDPRALEEKVRKLFEDEVKEHELSILRDDGLYRHIRFSRPETIMYSFDLVTWPGYLAIVGDMGDYVFSRLPDMFDFFKTGYEGLGINPDYWAQKLQAPRGDAVQIFSSELYEARVKEFIEQRADDVENPAGFRDEAREALLLPYLPENEYEAHDRLSAFGLDHSWDWGLREFSHQFLWCCWAIAWGVEQYQATQEGETK